MSYTETIRENVGKITASYRTSAVISDTATSAGEIDVRDARKLTLFLKYTKGTEGGLTVTIKGLHVTSGDEHQLGTFVNSSGNVTAQVYTYLFTATANIIPIEINVVGYNYIKVYEVKTSGTASGTLAINYIKSNAV